MSPSEETAFLVDEYVSLWADHGIEGTDELRHALTSRVRGRAPGVAVPSPAAAPALRSLDDVRAWLGDCKRCRLCDGRQKIVFGAGDPKARLLFVGEGPGSEEDREGAPFVGPAGALLTKIVEAMGQTRDKIYIANVVKCRPPENRVPQPDEIAQCAPFLKAQIELVSPKLIVALGGTAAALLTGSTGKLGQIRGKFQALQWNPSIPVMPTYHPAYLLRSPDAKKTVWEDMKLVMSRLEKRVKNIVLGFLFAIPLFAAEVPVLVVADSINPGSGHYIVEGIKEAEKRGAPYVIIQLDTPGGLLHTTRQIVQQMLNAKIPVVVFIGPRGAQAGSAGAILTFAADIAAMTPGSNIGAAHPVLPGGEKLDDTMREKMANDTAAFAESLARSKGRNAEWAVRAVKESASLPADEALKSGVIDLLADDLSDLTKKLDGRKLKTPKHGVSVLPAGVAETAPLQMTIKQRIVSFFADPNLAYLIMSLGGLCIWIELTHPGLILPGVIGILSIVISLISFQLLPIDYGALALIFVGMGMLVAELFLPTYGALGLGGIACFIFGSLFLMDTNVPELRISLGLILPTATVLASFICLLGVLVWRSRRLRQFSGMEAMIGEFGEVRETVTPQKPGKVFVRGELWSAIPEGGEELPKSAIVVVKALKGMQLVVEGRPGGKS